ncbi:MAG TPA: 50S ribosomal protein L10, partial [Ignisphaera sp.]|nr:50S ribosomal protein L10 [Ignisphaera sp.]
MLKLQAVQLLRWYSDMRSWLRSELQNVIKAEVRQGIKVKLRERKIPEEKRRIVEEAKDLLRKYRTFALLDLSNMPSKVITYLRRAIAGKGVVKLIKNRLFERALDELNLPNKDEVKKYLQGQNIIVFTNMNAFELKMFIDKIEVPVRARPGMTIDREIIVPPMKTNLKPGPIMSLFGRFRIPVQVREGVIWIAKEVTVAKPGDVVTPELTSLFEKLGIEPIVLKPKIKLAYETGLVIPAEKLVVDVEAIKNDMLRSVAAAISLAAEIVLPEPEV